MTIKPIGIWNLTMDLFGAKRRQKGSTEVASKSKNVLKHEGIRSFAFKIVETNVDFTTFLLFALESSLF